MLSIPLTNEIPNPIFILSDKVCQSNPEFGSNLRLNLLRKLPVMLESKKVKIGLILLKLLSDKVQIISKLVVFLSNREKVITTD